MPFKSPEFAKRLVFGSFIALSFGLLGVAATLDPSPSGLGTHQQLGLPPCSMRLMLGIRCPACGMTTSWAHFMHGEWLSSIQVNIGGFLLALYVIWFSFVLAKPLWTGQAPSLEVQKWAAICLAGIAVIAFVNWGIQMLE